GFFSISANGALAYRSDVPGGGSQPAWFDREGKSLGTTGPPGISDGGLALAPDGKRVAVDRLEAGNRDIWVLEVGRGVPTRFTFDPARDSTPVWSPDGMRLAFASDRSG